MHIESLQITSFAGINGRDIEIKDGLNIIEGSNEAGKSTLAEFIRYIFYGFSGKSERDHALGFVSSVIAGSIVLSDGDKRYRIERKTVGVKDSVSVYDLETGSTCFDGRVPGEVFFGMPLELFSSTAFVGQTGGSRIKGKDTSQLLDNLLFAADEGISVKKSLERLDKAKVALLYKNKKGGRIYELEGELSALESRYEHARRDGEEILETEDRLKENCAVLEKDRAIRDRLISALSDYALQKSREGKARLSALEKSYTDALTELSEHRGRYTRSGFFPDQSYLQSLRDCATKVGDCDRAIELVEKRLENLNREMEKNRAEREEALRLDNEKKARVSAKRGFAAALAVICLILSILSTVFCAVMFIGSNSGAGIGLGALSILALALMIGGFVLVTRYSSEIREIENHVLIHDDGYEAKLDVIREELNEKREERAKYSRALNDLCLRWDMKYSKAAITEMVEVIEKDARLSKAAEHARIAYVQMKTEAEERSDSEPEDDGREICLPEGFDYRDTDRRLKVAEESVRLKEDIKHRHELRLAQLYATSEKPYDIAEEIKDGEEERARLCERYDAYSLAYSKIESASERMRQSVSPRLSRGASDKMAALTGGKYAEIGVDGEFAITFRPEAGDGRVTRDESFMSAGTSDIAYVSLRLSLSELISGEKLIPTVFDESFSRLDDKRLSNMLKLISAHGGQTVVLTSNRREAETAQREGIPYNFVNIG